MDRSTAKRGTHFTLGTPREVGQCYSKNNENHPVEKTMQWLHLVERPCLSQTRCVAFPAFRISVYVSVVRPVLEYACPVWHINLPQYLSDDIEIIQKKGIKMYFSWIGLRGNTYTC